MAKYLLQVNYVGEGITGLLKEGGTGRRAAAEKTIKEVGGTVEAFYYAFGETDAYVIVDAPDNASIAAVALSGSATGRIKVRTTALMKPEELDEAARKAPGYRAPGQ